MFYKLSNTCELADIENEFCLTFRYPNLYKSRAIINGLVETNLPIVTSMKSSMIDFAIWGLLPKDYDDEWEDFQEYTNTLNTNIHSDDLSDDIYSETLDQRRCLIIINGFFTSKLVDGKLQTHHVHLKNHKPFCVAGIYNKILDGFFTCSLLITNATGKQNKVPFIGKNKPLIFKKKDYNKWLNPNLSLKDLKPLIDDHVIYDFMSHPVKEGFYNNEKVYNKIVNSDDYQSIMRVSRD